MLGVAVSELRTNLGASICLRHVKLMLGGCCREVADYMREQEGQGATCILLAVGMSIVGAFSVKDPLKPEAVGVVSALRNMGLQCHMVTGDNWTTARIVAAQLGIIHVMAEVLPAGKAEKVRLSHLRASSRLP